MNEITSKTALAACPLCKTPGFEATKGYLFCNDCKIYIGKTETAHTTFSAPYIQHALRVPASFHVVGEALSESFVFWFTLSLLGFLALIA